MKIIALCGPVASGKTTLAKTLSENCTGVSVVSTSSILADSAGRGLDRVGYLEVGNRLDRSDPRWILGRYSRHISTWDSDGRVLVIDAIRNPGQARNVRLWGGKVVMLGAPRTVLAERIQARGRSLDQQAEDIDYGQFPADYSFDTFEVDMGTIVERLFPFITERKHSPSPVDAIIGGQYGSEGKGNIVSVIASKYSVLVRSGGPNAGHTVILPDGSRYCYHHLPSGTRHNPEATVVIAPGAAIEPVRFLQEVRECMGEVNPNRLKIDHRTMVIHPADRYTETDGSDNLVTLVGSTGQGVGTAAVKRINRRNPEAHTVASIPELRDCLVDVPEYLSKVRGRILLEGTQGSGLSLYHGPYPYTTSRDTNVTGLLSECGVEPCRLLDVYAVFRTFPIRVGGNSGPMRDEVDWDYIAKLCGTQADTLRERERTSTTKRLRRVAMFDWDLFDRTVMLNKPTDLVLTFADYISTRDKFSQPLNDLIAGMEMRSGTRVRMVSFGNSPSDVVWR